MRRLIDADALAMHLADWQLSSNEDERDLIEEAIRAIDTAPTVDAVPVVRCKDCKWYGRVDKRRFYRGMDCLQKHIDTIVPDRDFCSKAERRGEQNE